VSCPPNIGPEVILEISRTKGVGYGQEKIHTRTDYHCASAGGTENTNKATQTGAGQVPEGF